MLFTSTTVLATLLYPILVTSSCLPTKDGHNAPAVKYDSVICNSCPGKETKANDSLWVNYNGTLTTEDGPLFDSSYPGTNGLGDPLNFVLDSGQVIKGFDAGLWDMCIGDLRVIHIPPEYGYGAKGVDGVIPPNATLGEFESHQAVITN
jgi:FKBP-type peptidyl-prolyl cis-trans isomerase